MALGDPYVADDELMKWLGTVNPTDGEFVSLAVESASREIEQWCGRQFNQADEATTRIFDADGFARSLYVDDFWSTDDLAIADEGSTWDLDDVTLLPRNPLQGWPYTELSTGDYRRFTRGAVTVTAKWGWPSVPEPVRMATLVLAAERFKLKEAPSGVAGFGEFGPVRVREMPQVASILSRYRLLTFVA